MLADANSSNIARLGNLYHMYQSKHGWMGPKSVDEFKAFLKQVAQQNPTRLEMMQVDPSDIEGLFVSERDGQPFEFRLGVQGSAMGSIKPVVFEVEGVDGERMVGFTSLSPQIAKDDAEYEAWKRGEYTPEQGKGGIDRGAGPPPGANQ